MRKEKITLQDDGLTLLKDVGFRKVVLRCVYNKGYNCNVFCPKCRIKDEIEVCASTGESVVIGHTITLCDVEYPLDGGEYEDSL